MENNSKKHSNLKTIILTLIITILLIFIIFFVRNIIILHNLQNNFNEYSNQNNYYEKIIRYNGISLSTFENYIKDNSYLKINTFLTSSNNLKQSIYNINGTQNSYIENNGLKTAYQNQEETSTKPNLPNYLETNNLGELLQKSLTANISSEYCNGKECYKISNIKFSTEVTSSDDNNSIIYIEKSTGLPVRYISGKKLENKNETNIIEDYSYEFNTVTDEILKEPNISEYKINNN